MLNFLGLIGAGNSSDALIRFFEIRLLKHTGYEPVLDRCLTCREQVSEKVAYYLVTSAGGLKCNICYQNNSAPLHASLGTIRTLLLGKEADLEKISRIIVSDQIEKEIRNILISFIYHLIGKDIKSLHILHEIRKMGI